MEARSIDTYRSELEAKNEELGRELELLRIALAEMEATNTHLISATWRERELKPKLEKAVGELDATKTVLDAQTKRMHESINYARNIQVSLMPCEERLRRFFPGSFMFYRPKDVVSGDFPWMCSTGRSIYIAAADCTGHGVPGALLSVIGSVTLNAILARTQEPPCGEVLDMLHKEIQTILGQDVPGSPSRDGMDIALVRIDRVSGALEFSGAHRPLYMERSGELIEVKGDKYPIGGTHYRNRKNFTTHTVTTLPGDRIYLFTDGLPDQFGGPDGAEKWSSDRVKAMVRAYSGIPMTELGELTSTTFDAWKGEKGQLDDVLLIGLQLPALRTELTDEEITAPVQTTAPIPPVAAHPDAAPLMGQFPSLGRLFRMLQGIRMSVAYTGDFTQEITRSVLAMLEGTLVLEGTDEGVRSKVFNVAMELLQNMSKHRTSVPVARSVFMLGTSDAGRVVITGNPIPTAEVPGLRSRLERINSLDAEGLKELYKQARLESRISSVGGAGLGFIDMAKRTGRQLVFDFAPIDAAWSYFALSVEIPDTPTH